ncbi:hypothetical protein PIROE2DRAFT_10471 [Piromyces sp. E2]|nr:hypothetical protein PIROE2DRAFT_10471 [Piromyces sp. E2]|eukprot:OUM63063.1 hypothetical protein PIROE2DRAFT_10471 [Piromyces sp. E2]
MEKIILHSEDEKDKYSLQRGDSIDILIKKDDSKLKEQEEEESEESQIKSVKQQIENQEHQIQQELQQQQYKLQQIQQIKQQLKQIEEPSSSSLSVPQPSQISKDEKQQQFSVDMSSHSNSYNHNTIPLNASVSGKSADNYPTAPSAEYIYEDTPPNYEEVVNETQRSFV